MIKKKYILDVCKSTIHASKEYIIKNKKRAKWWNETYFLIQNKKKIRKKSFIKQIKKIRR